LGQLFFDGRLEMTNRYCTTLILALAVWVAPAYATIQFSYCTTGCSSTGGSYPAWQTAPGSAGLVFSMSPLTFAAGGLNSGVFTDTSGTVFTGYNGASTNPLTVTGTSLANTIGGTGTGIDITLPANTYAIAFMISVVSGFGSPVVELNDRILNNANYQIIIPNSSSPQFFGILSNVPLSSLFVGNNGAGGAVQFNSFELGQASPTPEGSSLLLIGSGLVLFGFLRHRRVHKPDRSLA